MEADQTEVQTLLCDAFDAATGLSSNEAQLVTLHRWRYAKVSQPAENKYFLDAELRLGAAGDWCIGGRIEAAFESADALATSLIKQLL